MPHCTVPQDLFTSQLGSVLIFALATVDSGVKGQSSVLPYWRRQTRGPKNIFNDDWSLPVDLPTSETNHLTVRKDGLPNGDLNRCSSQIYPWEAQQGVEYSFIYHGLNDPNPFTPSTTIRVSISKSGDVKLIDGYTATRKKMILPQVYI